MRRDDVKRGGSIGDAGSPAFNLAALKRKKKREGRRCDTRRRWKGDDEGRDATIL